MTDGTFLKTKVIEIGDWDMNVSVAGTPNLPVNHGITDHTKIRRVNTMIRDDVLKNLSKNTIYSSLRITIP